MHPRYAIATMSDAVATRVMIVPKPQVSLLKEPAYIDDHGQREFLNYSTRDRSKAAIYFSALKSGAFLSATSLISWISLALLTLT